MAIHIMELVFKAVFHEPETNAEIDLCCVDPLSRDNHEQTFLMCAGNPILREQRVDASFGCEKFSAFLKQCLARN